jgi:hypothetical protein
MIIEEQIFLTRGTVATVARVHAGVDVVRFATRAELEFLPIVSALESELEELLEIGLAHSVSTALEPLLARLISPSPHTFP